MIPFTIRLVDRLVQDSALQPVRLKLDPGSKTTGGCSRSRRRNAARPNGHGPDRAWTSWATDQRGSDPTRRHANAGVAAIFAIESSVSNNRRRVPGWLPPSTQHRVDTTESWTKRLIKLVPITAIDQELVKFDMQLMQDPVIEGVGYQQGSMFEYEVREYCLEKWNRTCMYCDATNTPLEVEHIVPRSKGGSNRPSNLGISCITCNRAKADLPVEVFVKDAKRLVRIKAHMKVSLRDAAAVNATRFAQLNMLKTFGLPVSTASGGKTKFNRKVLGVPKTHSLDAACVGDIVSIANWRQPVLTIRCTGRGAYKRTRLTKHGFPRGYLMRQKSAFGFSTGDMVVATIPIGKKAGIHCGRVAIRASGSFNVTTPAGVIQGLAHRHMRLIQRADGYGYSISTPHKTTLLPGLNAGVSARKERR